MIASFERPQESKPLYFNLNNSFHLSNISCSETYKIAGIYALFMGGVCYYVGQSKNIPSRLSTHLTGKYKLVDEIHIYLAGEYGLEDFYLYSKADQTTLLESNEMF